MSTLAQVMAKSEPCFKLLNEAVLYGARKLVERCYNRGVEIRITQGYRTIAYQNQLFAQGRTTPGSIVTKVRGGYSYHNYGLAIDFVLMKSGYDMKADADGDGEADWMEVVTEAKLLGFSWGGDWQSFKDYPHFEINFGLTTTQLFAGLKPTNLQIANALNKMRKLEEATDVAVENAKQQATIDVLTERATAAENRLAVIEKRLNISGKETYYESYTGVIEAAKDAGVITSYQDKSKIELNILTMLGNAGLLNKDLIAHLKNFKKDGEV